MSTNRLRMGVKTFKKSTKESPETIYEVIPKIY